ncbi:MAG: amino acid permease [Planctomycetes bacterium]|nr:amino acid permease [Planctomycetota bacterium]
MSEKPQVTAELSRDLNLFHLTMMGLGMMIGAGVFLGMGVSIGEVGPGGLILTFALNGVVAMFTAMSYAELSSAIPKAGGAYNFARLAFGRGTSFISGWMEWFASSVAGSTYAITFSIYTVRALHEIGLVTYSGALVKAVAVACFFIYINYRGASETGKIGALITLGQTLFMLVIGVAGVVVIIRDPGRFSNFAEFMPRGWVRLFATMGFTYVAFEGYEVIAQAGDEAVDPRRNLPKAMLASVACVTLIYVMVAFATVVSVKAGEKGVTHPVWEWIGSYRAEGFGEAIARLMPYGRLLLTLAVIFSSTSALNATIYSATRASYALGRDRMLPGHFARISEKRRTPWVALLFSACIVIAVAVLLPTEDVAASASIMFLFLFLVVNLSVIKVRRNMGEELSYGYVMPMFPVFPVMAVILQALLASHLVHVSRMAWVMAPAWVAVGTVVYYVYSRRHAVATDDEIRTFEEEKAPEGDEYRMMVAVANPKNAVQMVRTTYKLGEAMNARVELLHMVQVPEQVPLGDAERYMMEGKEAIVEAMIYLSVHFPVSTALRYCRSIARGIVSAVREKKINLLVMGWHGRSGDHPFTLGSTVDPIIERSPCNVVVLKGLSDQRVRKVLVPVAGGPNGGFALEVASILVDEAEGEIVAFTVDRGRGGFDIGQFVDAAAEKMRIPRERVSTKMVRAENVVKAILEESKEYDLVVLGATRQSMLYQMTREPVPETVARMCEKPLVLVRASGGFRSWLRRWI